MRTVRYTGQFKKDARLLAKRGYDMKKLRLLVERLVRGEKLEARFKDHPLQGEYAAARDCHIGPDWILIYAIVGDEVRLIRTGAHSDLFR